MILMSHRNSNMKNRIQDRANTWALDTSGAHQAVVEPDANTSGLRIVSRHKSQGSRVYHTSGNAVTLASCGGGHGAKTGLYSVDDGIRRLTPLECERLQAFPDDWTKYGQDGAVMSDTQRYKMIGNAVTVSVIQDIMGAL